MPRQTKTVPRIGIYAGSFDPIHSGHIAFALQAIQAAGLDEVVFLPERRPRYKPGVEHFAHRVAMIKTAITPHRKLAVAELADKQFTVYRTLPQLRARYPKNSQFVFLAGSDTAALLPTWDHADNLLRSCELVVGVRHTQNVEAMRGLIADWAHPPLQTYVLTAHAPHVSSTAVRAALRANYATRGLLASVHKYARKQWLYVSLEKAI